MKGRTAENLVKFMIEEKMASGSEIFLWAMRYQPDGRQTFDKVIRSDDTMEKLKRLLGAISEEDRLLTQQIRDEVADLEDQIRNIVSNIKEEDSTLTEKVRSEVTDLERVLDGKNISKAK